MLWNRNIMFCRSGVSGGAGALLGAAVVAVAIPVASAQTFTGIGVLPEAMSSEATALSADGSTVVGIAGTALAPNIFRAFRWTMAGGMEDLGLLPDGWTASAHGVNADGSVVVGGCTVHSYEHAFRWTPDGMQDFPMPADLFDNRATAISADGAVIAGHSGGNRGHVAFRWTSAGGIQELGGFRVDTFPVPVGVSGDGSIIAGFFSHTSDYFHVFRWTSVDGPEDLGTPPGFSRAFCTGISADGSTIVGYGSSATASAFRWTRAGGMQLLPNPPGASWATARATSADGSVLVGSATGPYAVRWDPIHGVVDLNTYLPARGIELNGWVLQLAIGVSADGRTMLGHGINPNGEHESWIAILPLCPADFNADVRVNSQDFFDFLSAFFTAEPAADFNKDGTVDSADFFDYLTAFFAGCA